MTNSNSGTLFATFISLQLLYFLFYFDSFHQFLLYGFSLPISLVRFLLLQIIYPAYKELDTKYISDKNNPPSVVLVRIRLKITKNQSGTYTIKSLSIKQLRQINELTNKRSWKLSKNEMNLYLSAE